MHEGLHQSKCYFFLFAHPDDEVYVSVFLNDLINQGKEVHVVYATSGDGGGNGTLRKEELKSSMTIIGIPTSNVHMLEIPEKSIVTSIEKIVEELSDLVKKYNGDCIIGQDYEGGHEGHDIVSFCAAEVTKRCNIGKYFVFPIYHGRPQERKGARFKPERKNFIEVPIKDDARWIKEQVLIAHASQKGHFDGLQNSSNDYLTLFLSRELFFEASEDIDFKEKPSYEVGYEYHRNGFKFDDFINAVNHYLESKKGG